MWGRRRGDATGVTTAPLLEESQGASGKDDPLGPVVLAAV